MPLADFFRVLGDPVRLRVVEFLCGGEHTAQECAEYVGLSVGVVARHLNLLTASGCVTESQSGEPRRYAIGSIRAAEVVLLVRSLTDDNELAITTCARIDQVRQATNSSVPQAVAKDSGTG